MNSNRAVLRARVAAKNNVISIATGKPVDTLPSLGGRPSKFRSEYGPLMLAFFDIEVHKIVDVEVRGQDGELRTVQKKILNTFPTFGRFASSIGVTRVTLRSWATAKKPDGSLLYPEFAHSHGMAKDSQESLLIEGGMSGAYPWRFAGMMAKRLLGWKYNPPEPELEPKSASETAAALAAIYEAAMKRSTERSTEQKNSPAG